MAKRNSPTPATRKSVRNVIHAVRKSERLASISGKSHIIKKKPVQRSAKKVIQAQMNAVQKDSMTPDIEVKIEQSVSTSILTNCSPSQIHYEINHSYTPVSTNMGNSMLTIVRSNVNVNSKTITSSVTANEIPITNANIVNNSQQISSSTQRTYTPSIATENDPFLNFVESGNTAERKPKEMID